MNVIAAVVATAVLGGMAVIQLLAASGLPFGRMLWGGRHRVLPNRLRIGSVISVALYSGFAWVLLARAGMLDGPSPFVEIATWVLFGYFVVGIGLNAISRSRPERRLATPLCAVLAICSLIVALG